MSGPDAVYFPDPAAFRAWMDEHHTRATEIVVGFHRRGSGVPSMTWPESVDVALCFGWIDGTVRRVDDTRYTRRFTPRTPQSIWSAVNIRRFTELDAQGLVAPAGRAAFARRSDARSRVYSHERATDAELTAGEEAAFRANAPAWEDFAARRPSYRRQALHWVVSARRPETRARRLSQLIAACAAGELVPPLRWTSKP